MSSTQFSRDPSDYRLDGGGHSRRRSAEREIPKAVIADAIRDGTVVVSAAEHHKNRVRLRTEYLGYEIDAVIDPEEGVVVSCFGDDAWKKAGL